MNSSCRWRSFCHFIALLIVKDPFKCLMLPRIPGCQVRGYCGHLVVRSKDTVDTWLSGHIPRPYSSVMFLNLTVTM